MKKIFFFLGGADAEMSRIREILENENVRFANAHLGWGAKASAYDSQIAEAAEAGFTPVLVELEVDCDLPETAVVIDHHGKRANEPASLLQVLALLGREPTRWDRIVAANDAGWFPGLQAMGATPEEMMTVRLADRQAQGITPELEAEAERALSAPEKWIGNIRVMRMTHSKTTPLGDRLAVEAISAGEPIPSYLVLSGDGEVNFSGDGALCTKLQKKFEGWSGGAGLGQAGETAFWGGYPPHEQVLAFLKNSQ